MPVYFHITNKLRLCYELASGVWMTAFPPTQSHQTKQANPFTFNQNQMLSGIFKMLLRLTSSHKCHPSCQNEPGNVHPPHQWRLLHRWGMGSYGQQPPASYLSQNCISHRSKQTVETLQETQFRQWNFALAVMKKWALLKVLLLFMKSTVVKYAEYLTLRGFNLITYKHFLVSLFYKPKFWAMRVPATNVHDDWYSTIYIYLVSKYFLRKKVQKSIFN